MQSNEAKKKKAPPVPKFESNQESKTKLLSKMGQLFQKLGESMTAETKDEPKQQVKQPEKVEVKPVVKTAEPDKKKLSLMNINEKLASMMNSKKDLIKPKVQTKESKEMEVQPAKRIDPQMQYDPNHPNNYDVVKAFYQEQQRKIEQPVEEMQIQEDQTVGLSQTEEKALKMMQKFGYKVGEGLGKNKQGITTPLTIKKTTESSCIILPSAIPMNYVVPKEVSAKTALDAFQIQVTKVIVLVNTLTIAQLDEANEQAIKSQLQMFGNITDWLVYLLGQELRIFVKFENTESAFKAFSELNQKFYCSNLVSIRFYNQQNFSSFKLDQPLHAHIKC